MKKLEAGEKAMWTICYSKRSGHIVTIIGTKAWMIDDSGYDSIVSLDKLSPVPEKSIDERLAEILTNYLRPPQGYTVQVAIADIRSLFPQIPKATELEVRRIIAQEGIALIGNNTVGKIVQIINVWIDLNAANIGKEGEK